MALTGKGMWIWQIPNCESGSAAKIASLAASGGFSHVLIKIANATTAHNYNKTTGEDYIPAVVTALRAKGIGVWGWHYIYGYNPTGEAAIAISQTKKYNMDGYVIDAEGEFDTAGRSTVAETFMTALRKGLPSTPVALCSYRWPTYHKNFPWTSFLNKCDYNMPQVYWMNADNPGAQLTRTYNEFKAISPFRPIIPVGPAFSENGWVPKADELTTFMKTAKSLGMTGASFFSWDASRIKLPTLWTAITSYSWPWTATTPSQTTEDMAITYVRALKTRNVDAIMALYAADAVHIDAVNTIQGTAAIRAWYTDLFTNKLPSATFTLGHNTLSGTTHHFGWSATSSAGKVTDGQDTLGVVNGKIAYHYSFFNIT
jgi:ketosteroid isomerase-like protein